MDLGIKVSRAPKKDIFSKALYAEHQRKQKAADNSVFKTILLQLVYQPARMEFSLQNRFPAFRGDSLLYNYIIYTKTVIL